MSHRQKDIISNLPDEVVDHILSYLPIKEVGRTSLLSGKWRYKWTTVPCLVFNDESLALLRYQGSMIHKLVSDIDRILLLHSGPICKFILSYDVNELPSDDMDRWILHISRHPIQEFRLHMPSFQNYKMPSCFFSFQSLTDLVLKNCLLEPPPSTIIGFKGLKNLGLVNVSLCQNVFEMLISSFMLEKLYLYNVSGVVHLNINARNLQLFNFREPSVNSKAYLVNVDAPNLQDLCFSGPSDYLRLKSTACITELCVCRSYYHLGHNDTLLKLLSDIPQIERLTISCSSFESLDFGLIPRALPTPYRYLRYLSAILNFYSLKESLGILCLFRSVPNLQKLRIKSFIYKSGQSISSNFWQADQWNSPFNRLQILEIIDLSGREDEIDFIGFVLLNSPLLMKTFVKPSSYFISSQRMSYGPSIDAQDWKIVKQIQSLNRASPNAQTIFIDLPLFEKYNQLIYTN